MCAARQTHEIGRRSSQRSAAKQLRQWFFGVRTERLHHLMLQQKVLLAISQDNAVDRMHACSFLRAEASCLLQAFAIKRMRAAGRTGVHEHRRVSQTADTEDQRSRPARDALQPKGAHHGYA